MATGDPITLRSLAAYKAELEADLALHQGARPDNAARRDTGPAAPPALPRHKANALPQHGLREPVDA
ncbi:hypothetical protein [Rhodovastum atsumiense]|uniref:hypothetical protein n=1 Tax=Rhodovastum atsumiense TaxID=504468 RepID=UPI001232001D|nr:hypothetical protein [Rhodovastum atsumiense]